MIISFVIPVNDVIIFPFFYFVLNFFMMHNQKKRSKKEHGGQPPVEESLEEIIENRKTVADAYRKILNSLEEKLKKDQ